MEGATSEPRLDPAIARKTNRDGIGDASRSDRKRLGSEGSLSPKRGEGRCARAFAGLATGHSVQPTQITAPFLTAPVTASSMRGFFSTLGKSASKRAPTFVRLNARADPLSRPTRCCLSARTGEPMLLCDSQALTVARTAATTALALEFLTDPKARTLAVIGTGSLAIEHAAYVGVQHPWSSIKMWSRSVADAKSARAKQNVIDDHGVSATVVESLEDAVGDADVLMLCTSSDAPVVEVESLTSSAVVTSISTSGA